MFAKLKAFFKNLFHDKTKELEQKLDAQIDSLGAKIDEVVAERDQLKAQLEEMKSKEDDIKKKKESKEPWVNLNTSEFDPERGFKVDLDWNDAFIQELKQSGIDGPNDDFIIQKWLAFLYEDIVKQLDASQEKKKEEKGSVSDYE